VKGEDGLTSKAAKEEEGKVEAVCAGCLWWFT